MLLAVRGDGAPRHAGLHGHVGVGKGADVGLEPGEGNLHLGLTGCGRLASTLPRGGRHRGRRLGDRLDRDLDLGGLRIDLGGLAVDLGRNRLHLGRLRLDLGGHRHHHLGLLGVRLRRVCRPLHRWCRLGGAPLGLDPTTLPEHPHVFGGHAGELRDLAVGDLADEVAERVQLGRPPGHGDLGRHGRRHTLFLGRATPALGSRDDDLGHRLLGRTPAPRRGDRRRCHRRRHHLNFGGTTAAGRFGRHRGHRRHLGLILSRPGGDAVLLAEFDDRLAGDPEFFGEHAVGHLPKLVTNTLELGRRVPTARRDGGRFRGLHDLHGAAILLHLGRGRGRLGRLCHLGVGGPREDPDALERLLEVGDRHPMLLRQITEPLLLQVSNNLGPEGLILERGRHLFSNGNGGQIGTWVVRILYTRETMEGARSLPCRSDVTVGAGNPGPR